MALLYSNARVGGHVRADAHIFPHDHGQRHTRRQTGARQHVCGNGVEQRTLIARKRTAIECAWWWESEWKADLLVWLRETSMTQYQWHTNGTESKNGQFISVLVFWNSCRLMSQCALYQRWITHVYILNRSDSAFWYHVTKREWV